MIALAGFLILVVVRNPGVWSYLARNPGVLDGKSVAVILSYGVYPLLMALAFWVLALGLGRRVMTTLAIYPGGRLDGIATAALGGGLLAEAVFYLGWAGHLTPLTMTFLYGTAAALGFTALKFPQLATPKSIGPATAVLAYAAFHLLILSIAPPTQWDARAYHLALPELYLRHGGLYEVPWLLHSHWPHLMEALYTVPLALGRDGAAALIHALACVLLVGGVFCAGGGWAGAMLLAGQPALLRVAASAHADGACALLFFAAAHALSRWEDGKRDGWLVAAGLLAGLSASAKLFGGAGAAAWTVWLLWKTRRPREAAIFCACAAAMLAPWLIRTWLATGDPLWPLLRLTPASAALAARNARTNLWSWPPPAWLAVHDGPAFLLAPLAGLAWLGSRAKKTSRLELVLWAPAPLLLALCLRHHEAWRYLMPVYAAAALSGARFFAAAFAEGGARRAAAVVLVALAASPVLALTQNNELFAALGLRSLAAPEADRRALFEDRSVDFARFAREARAVLPPGARVLLFREVRGYGAGFDYLWGDPVNQNQIEYRRLADDTALGARLKELDVTYVLDHENAILYGEDPLYYDARILSLMSGLLKRHARPVLARNGFVLHQLL